MVNVIKPVKIIDIILEIDDRRAAASIAGTINPKFYRNMISDSILADYSRRSARVTDAV